MTDPTRTPLTAESEAFLAEMVGGDWGSPRVPNLHRMLAAIEKQAATAERERIAVIARDAVEDHQPCSWEDDLCWVHDFQRPCPVAALRAILGEKP